jgi:hypothetical protein
VLGLKPQPRVRIPPSPPFRNARAMRALSFTQPLFIRRKTMNKGQPGLPMIQVLLFFC